MTKTKIEWATDTWNPLRARLLGPEPGNTDSDFRRIGWHCEKISAGCANCYAERFNGRRLPAGGTGLRYARDQRNKAKTYLDESVLADPLCWRKQRRVFVCSMTDLFGEWVTDEQIVRVYDVMDQARQHTFMALTKRAERMRRFSREWPPNVWLGVSVEDQATADERIPHLIQTTAAKRFVSYEPALGPVDLGRAHGCCDGRWGFGAKDDPLSSMAGGRPWSACHATHIDLVIFGGESGPGARPCNVEWARTVMAQCKTAGVPFFLKQLGARPFISDCECSSGSGETVVGDEVVACPRCYGHGALEWKLRDRKGGDMAEWPVGLRVREVPE